MHHVIQVNLFNEFGFKQLLDALNENGCPYTVVKVIPFAHTLEPEVEFSPDEKVMVWGSLTLDGIALTPDTPVMYAEPKEIDLEGRFFIVDNVVVSGSSYRTFGKQVMYQTIDSNNPVFNPTNLK